MMFMMLMVARNQQRKGFDRLFKALSILKEKRDDFMIWLHTQPQEPMSTLAFDLPDLLKRNNLTRNDVWFHAIDTPGRGQFSSDMSMRNLYALADINVLPSSAEGWGMPLTESMMVGTPNVTTDFGPMHELCCQNRGHLVPYCDLITTAPFGYVEAPIDIERFAETLDFALNVLPIERTQMVQRARKWVEAYCSWETVGQQWVDYFDNLEV